MKTLLLCLLSLIIGYSGGYFSEVHQTNESTKEIKHMRNLHNYGKGLSFEANLFVETNKSAAIYQICKTHDKLFDGYNDSIKTELRYITLRKYETNKGDKWLPDVFLKEGETVCTTDIVRTMEELNSK